jgi:hypothetical protein
VIKLKETFVSSTGFKVTVNIPDRTEEEEKERDRQIKRDLISIYKRHESTKKHLANSVTN